MGKMSTQPQLIIDRKLKKDTLILEPSGKVKAFALQIPPICPPKKNRITLCDIDVVTIGNSAFLCIPDPEFSALPSNRFSF